MVKAWVALDGNDPEKTARFLYEIGIGTPDECCAIVRESLEQEPEE